MKRWLEGSSIVSAALFFAACFPTFDVGGGGAHAGSTAAATTTEASGTAQMTTVSTNGPSSLIATSATSSTGMEAGPPLGTGGRTQHSLGPMTSYDMALPPQTTVQIGDTALVTLFYDNSTAFISPPPDWTLIDSSDIGVASAVQWYVHQLEVSDGPSFTFTSNISVSWRSSISTFTNVTHVKAASADASPVEPVEAPEASVGTYDYPSLTTAVPNTMLYWTGVFPGDVGFVNWSSTTLHLEGFGDGILIFDEVIAEPTVTPSPTISTPNGGKGAMLVNTFELTP